jgi:hypothetical protein
MHRNPRARRADASCLIAAGNVFAPLTTYAWRALPRGFSGADVSLAEFIMALPFSSPQVAGPEQALIAGCRETDAGQVKSGNMLHRRAGVDAANGLRKDDVLLNQ